ncbi:MAG: glucose-6-phosphate isomerase [Deltaproteobacteria bacterium]|nr:glucose-6-phosphate isomerase [Deltaproteobacteria bacterium]
MKGDKRWQHFRSSLCHRQELGLTLDISRMGFPEDFLPSMSEAMADAFRSMEQLEQGAIANPDEERRVGHYWLRSPGHAPDPEISTAITEAVEKIRTFARRVHEGEIVPKPGKRFSEILVIGIGGSALGPQLLADALGKPGKDALGVHFFDNTDPDGMARCLAQIGSALPQTLCLVISKSGGTAETRNGMEVARRAFQALELPFGAHAVAITGEGSALDRRAQEEGWLERFPMWSWVGGRTSITSAVGLLPAALQGLDIDGLLGGAAACDEATRDRQISQNPAALLALMWYFATQGRGEKDMVILPYKDRLVTFSRYLQQLIMESLGKEKNLHGAIVEQGIAVYGNKGSTDQHAYVQQLREGVNNFFATFIQVLEDGGEPWEVEPGITSGDYLRGFFLGTRQALSEKGRPSITLTLERLNARSLGVLIALYERAVGLYACLIEVNAYHQPGVEAGKKAAAAVLSLQRRLTPFLASLSGSATCEEIAQALGQPEETETLFHLLQALAANSRGVKAIPHEDPAKIRWTSTQPETASGEA